MSDDPSYDSEDQSNFSMSDDKMRDMRAEFHSAIGCKSDSASYEQNADGSYYDETVNNLWQCWQFAKGSDTGTIIELKEKLHSALEKASAARIRAETGAKSLEYAQASSAETIRETVRKLEEEKRCWIFNANELQKGYNKLDADLLDAKGHIGHLETDYYHLTEERNALAITVDKMAIGVRKMRDGVKDETGWVGPAYGEANKLLELHTNSAKIVADFREQVRKEIVPEEFMFAIQEVMNIANAQRFNKEHFPSDTEFADWVVSRAKHTAGKITQLLTAAPKLPSKEN